MNFLKSFFANEKSAEEKALMSAPKERDVITLDAYAMDDEEETGGCGGGGCGGCGCR